MKKSAKEPGFKDFIRYIVKVAKMDWKQSLTLAVAMLTIIPIKLAVHTLDLVRLDNFFDVTLLSLFGVSTTAYLALLAHLTGVVHMAYSVEALSKGKDEVVVSRGLADIVHRLFSGSSVYVTTLTPILCFLALWSGQSHQMLMILPFMFVVWLLFNILREVFTEANHLEKVREHTRLTRLGIYLFFVCWGFGAFALVVVNTPLLES